MIKKQNRSQEHEHDDDEEDEDIFIMPPDDEIRIIGLYGPIDDERCGSVISMLYHMKETGKEIKPLNPDDEKCEETITTYMPIEFLISTEGGAVTDMFAVYDVMQQIQKDCEVTTLGIGKVMSAGLLLLAAGTPGKRKIGKHCRLMIHPISTGNYGQLHDLDNTYREAKEMQEMYIQALCQHSKLTPKKIKTIFKKKLDYYFNASQALEWGIVDEII